MSLVKGKITFTGETFYTSSSPTLGNGVLFCLQKEHYERKPGDRDLFRLKSNFKWITLEKQEFSHTAHLTATYVLLQF